MHIITNALVFCVGFMHFGFLVLEMFLWRAPLGRRIFRMSQIQADATSALAANQGLYNGFLAGGLWASFFLNSDSAFYFRVYFLICVMLAGAYGAWSVSRRILFVQAMPAAVALFCIYLS